MGGTLYNYTISPVARLISQGVVLTCFLGPSWCFFSFPSSLKIIPDGGYSDMWNCPGEVYFVTGLLPPVLPQPPSLEFPHHSQNGLLQHTSYPITCRINTLACITRSFLCWLLPFSPGCFPNPSTFPLFLMLCRYWTTSSSYNSTCSFGTQGWPTCGCFLYFGCFFSTGHLVDTFCLAQMSLPPWSCLS